MYKIHELHLQRSDENANCVKQQLTTEFQYILKGLLQSSDEY
jgi:hypothetical protein